ncbi:class I SAM-dependent rRNA methyltransferase [Wenzhouxiangella sp. XN24]|uniref:RsmD family RNA methyltransferase n=1 Tax=Wenzhouxiangella sp. XN24 TaxID=2713569 RepID=UPI0013EC04D3|nr:class I SAM-dependent rRNA methyltransferase [Wenzhouxiangella sp. XN24]
MNQACTDYPELRLKPREDRRPRAGHLWIYSNEVDTAATPLNKLPAGAIVRLMSAEDRFLGYAGVSPHSLIVARILSRDVAHPPDRSLVVHRLKVALAMRERLYGQGCYRALFADGDGLPGLVVDRFGDIVVLQAGTATMENMKGDIVDAVTKVYSPAGILWRNDSSARKLEGLERYVEVAAGEVPDEVRVVDNALELTAPLRTGQKTGWFYDQRDNRARLARYRPDSVLDVFSYTGAWGLAAAARGARAMLVDSSATALEVAERDAQRLGLEVETAEGQAFDVMKALADEGRSFAAVVVDPPAFIKRRKDQKAGLIAYQRANQLAMRLLERDGLLVSCSCSFHLSQEDHLVAIQRAARHLGRAVQVLELGGQSADHPSHPLIPETRYLKAVFCRIVPE